jgi:hypothetical protein
MWVDDSGLYAESKVDGESIASDRPQQTARRNFATGQLWIETTMKNDTGNPRISLRIPPLLGAKLSNVAVSTGATTQAVILAILAKHYAVDVPAPARGRVKRVGKKVQPKRKGSK